MTRVWPLLLQRLSRLPGKNSQIHRKTRFTIARTSSVYPAARMSSNITPKPPLKRISNCRIGGGFTTSKARNRKNAAACHHGSSRRDREHQQEGDDLVPAHRAVVGDAEVAPGEPAGPDAGAEQQREHGEQRQRLVAAADQPTRAETRAACPRCPAPQGDRPAPKPSAMKCAGWLNANRARRPRDDHGAKWSKPRASGIGLPCASSTCSFGLADLDAADAGQRELQFARQALRSRARRSCGAVNTSS